jgi:hypothetical protein
MTIETWVLMLGAAVSGAILGADLVWWYLRRREASTVAVLRAALRNERARRTMAEHRLAFWIGLRETTIITVDRRREP